jgi:hypothetical protein
MTKRTLKITRRGRAVELPIEQVTTAELTCRLATVEKLEQLYLIQAGMLRRQAGDYAAHAAELRRWRARRTLHLVDGADHNDDNDPPPAA